MPKVLVSDKLSEESVKIFEDKNIEVDYLPDIGKDKEKLAEIIKSYDGLAIRSATKVTEKVLNNANDWMVGHEGADATNPWHKYCYLNGASVVEDAATFWNDTAPTSSVVSLGTHSYVNYSGRNYIMYAWHNVEGYQRFGTYEGNNTDNKGENLE